MNRTQNGAGISHRIPQSMRISHLIRKLETLDPELPVALEVRGYISVPIGAGDAGEMMYREPCEEPRMFGTLRLHPDDIGVRGQRAVLSISYMVSYELTDKLRITGGVASAKQHDTDDPEWEDEGGCKTLVLSLPIAKVVGPERH